MQRFIIKNTTTIGELGIASLVGIFGSMKIVLKDQLNIKNKPY